MVEARAYRRSQRVRSQPNIGSCLSKILADSYKDFDYGKMVYFVETITLLSVHKINLL